MFRQPMILLAALVVSLVAATFTFTTQTHAQAQAGKPTRIAVVDIQKVFNDLDERTAVEADITRQNELLQKEEQDRQQQFNALQSDLKILAPDSDAFKQTRDKLETKAIEFQVWKQVMTRKLEAEKTARIELLYKKAIDAIGRAAKANGYDLVLFKDSVEDLRGQNQQQVVALIQLRKVLYVAPELDITESITQTLNNEYNTRKPGATPAPAAPAPGNK